MPGNLRVLVTGAARAIGLATAQELARRGHAVTATARDISPLQRLTGIRVHMLDVTSDASVQQCLADVGAIDAIVNNAAMAGAGPLDEYPLDRFRQMFETNTIGPLRLIQAVLPMWRKRGSGVIVNVSSVNGQVASPLEGAYSASKFALEAMTESLHYELNHFGIRSVIIQPGYIAPGMKFSEQHLGPADYAGLWQQWNGTDAKLTGSSGRPGPELVAVAIANAIEDPKTPLRVPVGADAEMILGTRRKMTDTDFEAAMRAVLGLTW